MDLITDPTADATDPGVPALAGTRGFFTGGVPGITAATRVRYWFLNMMMKELVNIVTSAGITPDPTNSTQVLAALQEMFGAGRWLNRQYFKTAGAFTYTPTAGTQKVLVRVQAAGGAGGGCPASGTGQVSVGGAGGGGEYVEAVLTTGFTGVGGTVGYGGAGGTGVAGSAGGNSSFGSVGAVGGGGGQSAGPATNSTGLLAAGGAGGTSAPGGSLSISGSGGNATIIVPGAGLFGAAGSGQFGQVGPGGGGGGYSIQGSTAATIGLPGMPGMVVIDEFS